jgi:hypothetical protein
MEKRVEELLVRGVEAMEALAKDPVIEIEAGPPVCPACGLFNPTVSIAEKASSGPLFEFVLLATCNSCGNRIYAVPQVWQMFTHRDEVRAHLEERRGSGNGN